MSRLPSYPALVLTLCALSMPGIGAALAAEPAASAPAGQAEPSKAMRERMAELHERMAACLRSEKSMAECRQEMMQRCRSMGAAADCPMMGPGMHMGGKGMAGRHGMQSPRPGNPGPR